MFVFSVEEDEGELWEEKGGQEEEGLFGFGNGIIIDVWEIFILFEQEILGETGEQENIGYTKWITCKIWWTIVDVLFMADEE